MFLSLGEGYLIRLDSVLGYVLRSLGYGHRYDFLCDDTSGVARVRYRYVVVVRYRTGDGYRLEGFVDGHRDAILFVGDAFAGGACVIVVLVSRGC